MASDTEVLESSENEEDTAANDDDEQLSDYEKKSRKRPAAHVDLGDGCSQPPPTKTAKKKAPPKKKTPPPKKSCSPQKSCSHQETSSSSSPQESSSQDPLPPRRHSRGKRARATRARATTKISLWILCQELLFTKVAKKTLVVETCNGKQ